MRLSAPAGELYKDRGYVVLQSPEDGRQGQATTSHCQGRHGRTR